MQLADLTHVASILTSGIRLEIRLPLEINQSSEEERFRAEPLIGLAINGLPSGLTLTTQDLFREKVINCPFFFLFACERQSSDLGHGYKLIGLDGQNAAIEDKNHRVVVDPNVVRYRVLGNYVVGERGNADIDDRLSKRYGFFVLDMRDGRYVEGLDEKNFRRALQERKLPSIPLGEL